MKIVIPENQNDITIGQYQEYMAIEEPTMVDSVSIFCNLSRDFVNAMKITDVTEVDNQIAKAITNKVDFIPQKIFNFLNKEVAFIPNIQDEKAGAYLDLENFLNIYAEKENPVNYHKAAAVMFRPVTTRYKFRYQVEKYEYSEEKANLYKDFPLGYFMGAKGFFLTLWLDCLSYTLSYTKAEATQAQKQSTLVKNGDSTKTYIRQLEESIKKLNELQAMKALEKY